MAKFPEISQVGARSPLKVTINFKTLVSNYDDLGKEQRKQKWLYPKRDILIQYAWITKDEMETLWEFYLARSGSYEAFNFFMPEPEGNYPSYTGEYVATGDGTTDTFNLP